MWENYRDALLGSGKLGSNTNVVHMMWVSFVVAIIITVGKIAILAAVGVCHRLLPLPFKMACFWAIFLTLMLPVEVRIMPTYKVVADLGLLEQLRRPDPAADRLGHATFLFRQFFLDGARRAGRGGAHRRRQADALLQDILVPLSRDLDRRAVRDPVHLRLEPVPVAAAR